MVCQLSSRRKSIIIMNKSDQDMVKSASNLQKLYSSQVHENYDLRRQKSDLDNEKIKKLRELNNNEQVFLRKYKKYLAPGGRNRRCSIDAQLLRSIEVNYSPKSRPQSQNADKYISRDSISSECPYSFETWNRLVDTEKSVIDENKRDILFGEDDGADKNTDSEKETDIILDEMARINISLLEQGKRLQRRRTLKPIETIKADFDDEAIDEEILEIQFKHKKRGRRHSVALGALHSEHLGRDPVLKLPSINESRGSAAYRYSSNLDLKTTSFKSSDDTISGMNLTRSGRELSLSDCRINFEMPSPVQEINTNEKDSICNDAKPVDNMPLVNNSVGLSDSATVREIKIKEGNIAKSDNTEYKTSKQLSTPRPVANATIFVQGETNYCQNSMDDSKDNPAKLHPNDFNEAQHTGLLPRIDAPKAHTDLENDQVREKHVSFDEDSQVRVRSDCHSSKTTSESESKPGTRSGRRGSIATTSLKLLVDSHHGAAKLRYIAKLAHEMEKEELAKHPPEPEPDIYNELNSCRYLRVVPRKESAESQEREIN